LLFSLEVTDEALTSISKHVTSPLGVMCALLGGDYIINVRCPG